MAINIPFMRRRFPRHDAKKHRQKLTQPQTPKESSQRFLTFKTQHQRCNQRVSQPRQEKHDDCEQTEKYNKRWAFLNVSDTCEQVSPEVQPACLFRCSRRAQNVHDRKNNDVDDKSNKINDEHNLQAKSAYDKPCQAWRKDCFHRAKQSNSVRKRGSISLLAQAGAHWIASRAI